MNRRIIYVLFIVTFGTGLFLGSLPIKKEKTITNLSFSQKLASDSKRVSITKILVNNLIVASLMAVGSITYGLIGLVMVFHNGYIISLFFVSFMETYGFRSAFLLLAPHGTIELVWLFILFKTSIILGDRLFSFLNNKIEINQILSREIKLNYLISLILVFVSGLIETFASKNIALYFNN